MNMSNTILSESINIYLNDILEIEDKEILVIEVFDDWSTDEFVQLSSNELYSNINGLIFLVEDQSIGFIKSRMIRDFFKNSFQCITTNIEQIWSHMHELAFRISSPSSKDIGKVLIDIQTLSSQIDGNFDNIQDFYPVGGIHSTVDAHNTLRELYDEIEESCSDGASVQTGKFCAIKEIEKKYDLASLVAANPYRCYQQEKGMNILIIDDNPNNVFTDNNKTEIVKLFPEQTNIYVTKEKEWEKLFKTDFWASIYNQTAILQVYKNGSTDTKKINLFKDTFFEVIVIDLLLGNKNLGNNLIQLFSNFRKVYNSISQNKDNKLYFDILVYSLSEEVVDISRALKEGALDFISKKRPIQLPTAIAKLFDTRNSIIQRSEITFTQKTGNFGRLYNLPELTKRQLQNESFLSLSELTEDQLMNTPQKRVLELIKANESLNEQLMLNAQSWIKKLPKAELHCHMGGSIRAEEAFYLSLNMLTDLDKSEIKTITKRIVNALKDILGKKDKIQQVTITPKFFSKTFLRFIKSNKNKPKEYFQKNEIDKGKLIKDIDLGKVNLQKHFFKFLSYSFEGEYKSDVLINVFNVIIAALESKESGSIATFWNKIKKGTECDENYLKLLSPSLKIDYESVIVDGKKYFEIVLENLDELKGSDSSLLSSFISAKYRSTKTLSSYLGGNEFMGSNQLKKPENIIAALYSIIQRAIDDNIRYLEIRLSPDGYVSKHLSLQNSIDILLEGTDLITSKFYQSKGKVIYVNYIFTVKRHKSPDQAALEVSSAVANRNRKSHIPKIIINKDNVTSFNYKWQPSKIVGLDLAGIEKGYPPSHFVNDFYPAFKTSTFITVHAGEEDSGQKIWEAVYLLQANRIGHGLTLQENRYLTELLKNLQVCIELNPISNSLTNKNIEREYPFYDYINKGINVSINTDNPAVSDSTLSEEYVKAAEFYLNHKNNKSKRYLSKWDTLRLVKNSFKSAFISRDEKRDLLRSVESEIYNIIVNEYFKE